MVYHQKTLCLLVGAGHTTTRRPRCSRSHPVQKQRSKVKILQLARDNSAVCQSHENILAQVLLHRLVPTIAKDHLPETQCGFRRDMGITDMGSFLRQLRKKVPGAEQRPFVDLAKGFDTVKRKGLQQILEHLGCPQSSSAWSSSYIKISRAKSGYTATY